MRTGIFVYGDSIDCTLRPEIPAVIKYNGPGSSSAIPTSDGTVTLTRGIYRLVTDKPPELQPDPVEDAEIVVVVNNKDPWPDPPAKFLEEFPDVTAEDLRAFLPAGFDAFDAPAPRASSDEQAPQASR